MAALDFSQFTDASQGYPSREELAPLLDQKFGKGKWRITGGHRSEAEEDELRREGAETVAPGKISDHELGSVDRPGAWDIAVDGLTPAQVTGALSGAKLSSGAMIRADYPEGAHGTQGGHAHIGFQLEKIGPVENAASARSGGGAPQELNFQAFESPKPSSPSKEAPEPPRNLAQGMKEASTGAKQVLSDYPKAFTAAPEEKYQPLPKDASPIDKAMEWWGELGNPGMKHNPGGERAAAADRLSSDPLAAVDAGLTGFLHGALGVDPGDVHAAEMAAGYFIPGLGREAPGRPPPRNMLRVATQPARPSRVERRAESLVSDRVLKDQAGRAPTATDMLELAKRTPEKPLTLMDVAGPRTRGLAGTLARSPKGDAGGKIETFLSERRAMQGPRLEGDVQRHIGAGSSRQTISSLKDAQKKAAAPLYDDAFEANPVVHSSVVDQIVRSKQGAAAWQEAQDRARGWVTGTDKPVPDKFSLRTLDQLKQVFDDRISVARRQGNNGEAALYKGLKDRLVGELDHADRSGGLYAKARRTFSDLAQSQEAVEFGRKALRMNPEDIADTLKGMTEGDREMARLGVAEALRDQVQATNVGQNAAARLARNRAFQSRLEPFFKSPQEMRRFMDSALAEDTMFRTDSEVLRGSQTAARRAEDEGEEGRMAGHAVAAGGHLAHGNVLAALLRTGQGMYEAARRPNPGVASRAADILTEPLSANGMARRALERSRQAAETRNHLKALDQRMREGTMARALITGNALATQIRQHGISSQSPGS